MARRRRPPKPAPRPAKSAESRAAEFMTVGWMVTVLTTLACEVASLGLQLWVGARLDLVGVSRLAGFLLLVSLVTGLAALVLHAIVWKARREPPPRGIAVFALVVSLLPFAMLVFR